MDKHFTATAVLVSDTNPKKVLLGLHRKLNVWLPPGGHIEPNETPTEAAIRETKEEAGIDISRYLSPRQLEDRVRSLPTPQYFFEEYIPEHKGIPGHMHLDFVYVITGIPERNPSACETEMSVGMRWLTFDELFGKPDTYPMYPNFKDVILADIFR